ncbi:MAG: MBL fold metallo-hydrolase, partial [Vicinamibacterales bacterium]
RSIDVATSGGQTVTLVIDASGLPTRTVSKSYNANLGDVALTTTFAEYQDVGGLKLPARLATKVDDFTTVETRLTKQAVDAEVGDLAAPAAVASVAAPAPAAPNVTAEQVAPGVWFLAGQSHHSMLVEFADHLMLIEAPQSEARTLAVIAKAREVKPGKPLTQLVTTHHHFDHTAGLRAAIAEGLTVITHEGNKTWVEAMAKRPHTRQPDALAKGGKAVTVETVGAERVLKDATMEVALYHVAGSPHSDTMLMAYIPKARALVEVDVFSPGAAVHPYAANLLENVTKRKLRVDRIVPLHGAIVPFAELTKTQTAAKTN